MPNQTPKFFPINTAEVLDKAVDVYKKSFLKQLAYSAIIQVISFMLLFIVGFVAIIIITLTAMDVFATDTSLIGGGVIAAVVILALIFLPLIFLWQAFASAGHILLAKQAFYGERVKISVGELPGTALRIITSIIAQLIVSLPFLGVGGLVFWFLWSVGDNLGGVSMAIVVIFIVALFLAYWIFTNVFALSIAVAVYEKRYFMSTITRSWQLVKGEFWKIFAVRVLWFLVVVAVTASLQGIFSISSTIISTFFGTTFAGIVIGGLLGLVSFGVNMVLSFATAPLEGILQATIYFNQRIKKEGLDIEVALERLEKHVV